MRRFASSKGRLSSKRMGVPSAVEYTGKAPGGEKMHLSAEV